MKYFFLFITILSIQGCQPSEPRPGKTLLSGVTFSLGRHKVLTTTEFSFKYKYNSKNQLIERQQIGSDVVRKTPVNYYLEYNQEGKISRIKTSDSSLYFLTYRPDSILVDAIRDSTSTIIFNGKKEYRTKSRTIYLLNEKGLITERNNFSERYKIEYFPDDNIARYYPFGASVGRGYNGYSEYSTLLNPYASSPELALLETLFTRTWESWTAAQPYFNCQSRNWPLKRKRDNFTYLNSQKVVGTTADLYPTEVVEQDDNGNAVSNGFTIRFDYINQ